MSEAIGSGTGAGLLAFLDWTIEKNELNKATASALKTGVRNVLSVEDEPDSVDLRSLDEGAMENFLLRFTNKTRGQFKDKSQEVYRQRFRQSVAMYLTWLDGGDWRPARLRPTVSGNGNGTPQRRPAKPAATPPVVPAAAEPAEPPRSTTPIVGLIEYPFPLRPGLRARLMLPEDLSAAEANRIAAFVRTLAFEDTTED